MIPPWLLAALAALEGVLLVRAWLAWRGHRAPGTGATVDLSVVIPLYGWDPGLPALVQGLLDSAYDAALEVIVVVDGDHPRLGDLPAVPRMRLLHPARRPDGWHDKVWRMRCGASAARHGALMFMDSDVTVDPDWLARRVARHRGDFSFALPLYAAPNNTPERLLAAFTNYSNFTLYKAAFAVRDLATAIGPSMLCTADRPFLIEGLESHRDALADDHCLGHWFRSHGRPVHLGAEPVYVAKHHAPWSEVFGQILRWLMLPRTVTHVMMPHAVAALAVGSLLNALPPLLVYAGLALTLAGAVTGPVLLAAGGGLLLTEGLACVLVEHAYARRLHPRRPWRHLVFVPVVALLQIWLLTAALLRRDVPWRNRALKMKLKP